MDRLVLARLQPTPLHKRSKEALPTEWLGEGQPINRVAQTPVSGLGASLGKSCIHPKDRFPPRQRSAAWPWRGGTLAVPDAIHRRRRGAAALDSGKSASSTMLDTRTHHGVTIDEVAKPAVKRRRVPRDCCRGAASCTCRGAVSGRDRACLPGNGPLNPGETTANVLPSIECLLADVYLAYPNCDAGRSLRRLQLDPGRRRSMTTGWRKMTRPR